MAVEFSAAILFWEIFLCAAYILTEQTKGGPGMTDKTLAALIQSDPEKGLAAALEVYGDCCTGILHRLLGRDDPEIPQTH